MQRWMPLRRVLSVPNLALGATCIAATKGLDLTLTVLLLQQPRVALGVCGLLGGLSSITVAWLALHIARVHRAPPCAPVPLASLPHSMVPPLFTAAWALPFGATGALAWWSPTPWPWLFTANGLVLLTAVDVLLRRQRLRPTERGIDVIDTFGRYRTISWDDVLPAWFCRGFPFLLILRDRSDGFTAPVLLLNRPLPLRVLLPSLQRYVDDPVARLELIAPATRRHTAPPPPPRAAHGG